MNQQNYKLEYIEQQLSELQLIRCSLLPDEHFVLLESSWVHFPNDPDGNGGTEMPFWKRAIESYADYELPSTFLESIDLDAALASPASFELKVDGAKIWFQVTLPPADLKASSLSEGDTSSEPEISVDQLQGATISVKGENITRAQQENWQGVIMEKTKEIDGSEFPVYQLLSLHLLPQLHGYINLSQGISSGTPKNCLPIPDSVTYHVLFTSHHLISPTKRRSLQHWSSSLSLSGFAKVGYPGVIYAEGEQSDIEEFVGNVKAMNWLGLRMRFVEPLDSMKHPERRWVEFQKVGEVVEEMRRIEREEHIVEMGIGSLGSHNSSV